MTSPSAIAIIGSENASKNETAKVIQTNTGILMKRIPFVRILIIVVIKLKAEISEAIPSICNPIAQKSIAVPGEYFIPALG